jgi:hypothetical protein
LSKLKRDGYSADALPGNNVMNDLVIAQVEDMIKKGADSSAFDSTLYIMDKLYKAEKNEQKWAKPNRTVFDEWNPSTR